MKLKILIILSILVLFLTGCGETDTGVGPKGPYQYTAPTAIQAKFVTGIPVTSEMNPYQKGENIPISIELTNMLPEDLPENTVRVRLTGDAAIPNYFTGAIEVKSPTLFGRDNELGLTFPEEIDLGPINYVGELPAKSAKTITAQYCYQTPVKVVGFLYYTDDATKIGSNLVSGSHPPSRVEITDILQYPVRIKEDNTGEMRFRVTIRNKGHGTVIESLDSCFQYRDRSEREILRLNAQGAYNVDCGDGLVRLSRDTKTATIDCYVTGIDPANLSPQPSELFLTLDNFAYEENISPVIIYVEP